MDAHARRGLRRRGAARRGRAVRDRAEPRHGAPPPCSATRLVPSRRAARARSLSRCSLRPPPPCCLADRALLAQGTHSVQLPDDSDGKKIFVDIPPRFVVPSYAPTLRPPSPAASRRRWVSLLGWPVSLRYYTELLQLYSAIGIPFYLSSGDGCFQDLHAAGEKEKEGGSSILSPYFRFGNVRMWGFSLPYVLVAPWSGEFQFHHQHHIRSRLQISSLCLCLLPLRPCAPSNQLRLLFVPAGSTAFRIIWDLLRFRYSARTQLASGELCGISFGHYLDENYGKDFGEKFVRDIDLALALAAPTTSVCF